jgi:hypothetical protein
MSQRRHAEIAILAVILVLGTWLRARGLDFGLPAVYNPDEVAILSRALGFAKGDLNPHNFLYPTFYFYVLFGWVGAYFLIARVTGAVASLSAFQTQFFTDPSAIYLAGRWLGVTCGVATLVAVWALGRRLFGRAAGLAAAAFLAVSPIAVQDAHYIKHDVPVTLSAVIAMLALAGLARPSADHADEVGSHDDRGLAATRRAMLAGAACGVAFSTHYYAVFLALPLAWGVWLASRRDGWRATLRLAAAGVASAVVFLSLSPFLLVEWRTALRDIVANRQIVVDRAAEVGGTTWMPSLGQYGRMLWSDAFGWPVVVLAGAGMLLLIVRDRGRAVLLLSFPIAFLLFIGNTVAASRYLNPVLPFVALLAGLVVSWLAGESDGRTGRWPAPTTDPGHDRAGQRPAASTTPEHSRAGRDTVPRRAWRRGWASAGLVVVAMIPGLRDAAHVGWFFSQEDTRTLLQRCVHARVPAGEGVLVQPYSVQLHQSREGLVEALTKNVGGPDRASTKFALRLKLDPYPAPAYRTIYLGDGGLDADKIYVPYSEVRGADPLAALRDRGIRFVVWKRYEPTEDVARDFVTALDRDAALVCDASPYADGARSTAGRAQPFLHNTDTPIDRSLVRPGPVVELWRLP